MGLMRAFLMVDGGPVVDGMWTMAVPLEELAFKRKKPVAVPG